MRRRGKAIRTSWDSDVLWHCGSAYKRRLAIYLILLARHDDVFAAACAISRTPDVLSRLILKKPPFSASTNESAPQWLASQRKKNVRSGIPRGLAGCARHVKMGRKMSPAVIAVGALFRLTR